MNTFVNKLLNICQLEEAARRDHWLNRIHPLVKLMLTIIYIVLLTSVEQYNLQRVLILGIYPVLLLVISDLPLKMLLPKLIVPSLLGISLGLLNPLLDPRQLHIAEGIYISAGWLSLTTLFVKSIWLVLSALMLVVTTPIEDIVFALERLKVPKIMCVQVLLTFRYITILVTETERIILAYSMRSGGKRSIDLKAWGPLIGQLFLSASKKSVMLYEAMKLRGFDGQIRSKEYKVKVIDGIYICSWIVIFKLLVGVW